MNAYESFSIFQKCILMDIDISWASLFQVVLHDRAKHIFCWIFWIFDPTDSNMFFSSLDDRDSDRVGIN